MEGNQYDLIRTSARLDVYDRIKYIDWVDKRIVDIDANFDKQTRSTVQ